VIDDETKGDTDVLRARVVITEENTRREGG